MVTSVGCRGVGDGSGEDERDESEGISGQYWVRRVNRKVTINLDGEEGITTSFI